jgi:hypothetical protein
MTDSHYAQPKAPAKAFRPFKKNPYGFKTKWNAVRIINYTISGGILLWVLDSTDLVTGLLRFVIWGLHVWYYLQNLYDIEDMEETFTYWNFMWKELKIPYLKSNKNIIVKFRLENEELRKYCPVDEIVVINPSIMTVVKNTNNTYTVIVDGLPKKFSEEDREELELRIKKFLDSLREHIHFKSVTYTVSNPKKECRNALVDAAGEGESNKPRDLHMQDLIQYVDTDTSDQCVTKYKYMLELGVCRNIKDVITRYNSVMPGFKELLKYSAPESYVVTDPLEIWKIFEEQYDVKEAY